MQTLSFSIQGLNQLQEECDSLCFESGSACLIQLFSSQSTQDVDTYYQQLRRYFPKAEIVGVSALHANINASVYSNSTVISISVFDASSISSAFAFHSLSEKQVGHQLLRKLSIDQTTKSIIAFGCSGTASNYKLFEAFSESQYSVPISGGVAVKVEQNEPWVFLNGHFYYEHIIAVALHGEQLKAWYEAFVEWNPIGKRFRITSSEGAIVKTIDHIPAYEFYCKYLADNRSLPLSQIQSFPLMLEEDTARKINRVEAITSEGYLQFTSAIPMGDEVRLCYYHPSLTQEHVNQGVTRLAQQRPESIFIYNCQSRVKTSVEINELTTFSDIGPCQGMYGMGEYFRAHNQQILHHSLTYLALRESEDSVVDTSFSHAPRSHNLTPLFSLIKNSIQDLDSMTFEMEKKISAQSMKLIQTYRTDRRTGLLNRTVLKERLAHIAYTDHLLSFKLTNLSQVNEKYGYQVGDKLLQDVSHYFLQHLGNEIHADIELYSLGVAEWGVIFHSEKKSEVLRKNITDFIENLEHENFEPYGLSDVDYLSVAISGGLISRRDFTTIAVEELILKTVEARRIAMRRNRHLCNARDLLNEERLRQNQLDRLTCVNRAISQKGVLVYGQPIFTAHTHELASTECLMRIKEDGQIFAPGQFLPAVEGTHLYTRLSREMISRSFAIMQTNDLKFSINLSPQDLMSDRTLDLLESSIIRLDNPHRVGFEVLETEQIQDYGRMIEVCNHFRRLGARIIIDDFGSGYSNIDEIMKLEPQVIKLDGSLIKNVHQDKRQRLISQQMVQLCHALDAKVVAEFVHNEEVCRIVEGMGVDYLQGYFLGAPTPLSD